MTPDEFDALQTLANVTRGIAQTLMLAHGFRHELIAGLVLAGLPTVVFRLRILTPPRSNRTPIHTNTV